MLPAAAKTVNIISPAKGVATTAANHSFFKKVNAVNFFEACL